VTGKCYTGIGKYSCVKRRQFAGMVVVVVVFIVILVNK
jgi:hypothetical protein